VSGSGDSGERTEQATQRRMKEVRSKGQLSRSQDMTAWLGVGAVALTLPAVIATGASQTADRFFDIGAIIRDPDPARALRSLAEGLGAVMTILAPLLVAVVVAVLVGAVAQGGIHLKKMTARFEQFNPVNGLKRIFGPHALWEGVKALLKTLVVGAVLFAVVQGLVPVLMSAGGLPVSALLDAAGGGTATLLQSAVVAGIALAAVDLFVVMRRNRKKTRMTKREVRDENKNTEGDPLIRSHRRSRQLALSRNRMIAAVAGSDVVLVNPTHVAVALKYEPGKSAPRVVAKGAGAVAARIRAEAETHRVPMVRDVTLARALHAACEIGQEIPIELYTAVARVLAFVMSLRSRGAASGLHRLPEGGRPRETASTAGSRR